MATAVAQADVPRTVANTDIPALITRSKLAASVIRPLLPPGVTLEQVAAQTRLALSKDTGGALNNCSAGSVLLSVAKIIEWNLVVGETAHLVPFGGECTVIRDYKGDIELAIRCGMVRFIEAHCVYEKEQFKIQRGFPTSYQHEVITGPDRGKMVGAYCFALIRGNHTLIEYRTVEEVDQIRQAKSKQWKNGAVPPWYMKKTVIKQLLKPLPKSAAVARAFAEMETDERAADIDAAIATMPLLGPGEPMAPQRVDGPRPLVTSGQDPYDAGAAVNNAPIPPAQFSDDPGFTDDDVPSY